MAFSFIFDCLSFPRLWFIWGVIYFWLCTSSRVSVFSVSVTVTVSSESQRVLENDKLDQEVPHNLENQKVSNTNDESNFGDDQFELVYNGNENLLDVAGIQQRSESHNNNDRDISNVVMLDNQLMKDMYLTSTDKVFTPKSIQHMIRAIASNSSLRLNEAVTTIVNLKLVQRLQFRELDSLYSACSELDSPNNSNNNDTWAHADGSDHHDNIDGEIKQLVPVCMSRIYSSANSRTADGKQSCVTAGGE